MAPTQDALYAEIDLELSWSERELPERERTKHVHRLHPYLGKFIPQLVEALHDVGRERTHDHRADEHVDLPELRLVRGQLRVELRDDQVRTGDHTHGGEGTDHRTPVAVDHPTAGRGDDDRQQVVDRRADHGGQICVGEPTDVDEEGREQAPRDQGRNVRHDHR